MITKGFKRDRSVSGRCDDFRWRIIGLRARERVAAGRQPAMTLCTGCHLDAPTMRLTGKRLADLPGEFGMLLSLVALNAAVISDNTDCRSAHRAIGCAGPRSGSPEGTLPVRAPWQVATAHRARRRECSAARGTSFVLELFTGSPRGPERNYENIGK
jgi:hypothetical protein